ncbi:MAG: PH domain-containing protein [Thermacetogeniaceae bacterium]
MGLPVLFENYFLTKDALHVRRGLLFRIEDRLLLYRVMDVRAGQTPFDRIIGTGTVVLYAADATDPVLVMRGVKRPFEVAELIQKLSENARAGLRLRGTETFGAFAGELPYGGPRWT